MPERTLKGVSVLVTRPAAQAQELVDGIEHYGGEAIRFPVIQIVPRDDASVAVEVAALQDPDVVILVSRNAVQYGLPFVANGKVAAIGPATTAALNAAGCRVDIQPAAGFDSEHLLIEPGLNDVAGKIVRIIRGNGGRELLAETLRQRGAHVEYLSVYSRETPDYSRLQLEDVEARWREVGIDAVTLMSVESVQNLSTLLPTWCKNQLHRSSLVAPAARVLKVALETFPGSSATLAAGPQTSDIIDAIISLGQTAPGHSS